MLGKHSQDLPISSCQAKGSPPSVMKTVVHPPAPGKPRWSGNVGTRGAARARTPRAAHRHGPWLHRGFPLTEYISGTMCYFTTPLTPCRKLLEPENSSVLDLIQESQTTSSLQQAFPLSSSSQLHQNLDKKLVLTRMIKTRAFITH